VYFVAGTQASDPKQNKIFVFKASELHKTRNDNEEENSEDEDEPEDDPILESRFIKHDGCVNRIRVRLLVSTLRSRAYRMAGWLGYASED
jgi:ribosome assembly protein RRB1